MDIGRFALLNGLKWIVSFKNVLVGVVEKVQRGWGIWYVVTHSKELTQQLWDVQTLYISEIGLALAWEVTSEFLDHPAY